MGCRFSTSATRRTRDLYAKDPDAVTIDHNLFVQNSEVYYWRNLPPNVIQRAEKLCHDKSFSFSRMLANKETLLQVCQKDEATLERIRISRFQIADVLETIKVLAERAYGQDLLGEGGFDILNGRYHVDLHSYGGIQTSPFEDFFPLNRRGGDTNIMVRRTCDNKVFAFGSLLISMIRYFGFFEGNIGSGYPEVKTFRVDPEQVVEFFGIKSNVDYSLTYESYLSWSYCYCGGDMDQQYEELTKIIALEQIELPNNMGRAYLTWLPALFCASGGMDRVPNLGKLKELDSIEDQMDYLIREKVSPLATRMGYRERTKKNVLKAVRAYCSSKETTGICAVESDSMLCLEVSCSRSAVQDYNFPIVLKNVFGAELNAYRGYSLYNPKTNRRLAKWNDLP